MKTETFLLRATCSILMLIILLLDYNQCERIKSCENSILEILQIIRLDIELERFKDEILNPDLPPLFPPPPSKSKKFPLHKKDLKDDEYACIKIGSVTYHSRRNRKIYV